ncbi:MAG: hypothetical protein QXY62_04265 [Candidatus Altiarchaeota archaeon]
MKNKAQTALEFLMTYGWALVIILVIIVVMWQFGLFNPKDTGKGSAGFWGIVPGDFKFTSNSFLLISFENQIGSRVNITKVNVTFQDENRCDSNLNIPVNPGAIYQWSNTFSLKIPAGSKFEIFISVDYIDDRTSETYRSSGKIFGTVEQA